MESGEWVVKWEVGRGPSLLLLLCADDIQSRSDLISLGTEAEPSPQRVPSFLKSQPKSMGQQLIL